jgi:hydroxyacylglutathione hydrolase
VVVQCASGARSTIASSLLLAHGVGDVINLRGGLAAWRDAGLAVAHEE